MSSIGGLASAASGSLKQQVGIAVLAKSQDSMKQQGQELIQLMEKSVLPHMGGNLDIKV
ncbi:YjfB family protein [Cohnella sp. WQ 127256]|uniref:YjfB family protein n=1 Tax=Cohnella sp. WQ 127256 TaxID=2938790 RepID=UPI0021193659|nr:YjfB family protein [Cohnella sp. WQ 127256]